MSVERELKFHCPVPPPKIFGSGSSHLKFLGLHNPFRNRPVNNRPVMNIVCYERVCYERDLL